MRGVIILLCFGFYVTFGEARKRSGAQDDFQFVEDGKDKRVSSGALEGGHRTWMLDPDNALCGLLLCGKRELCLLQDRFTAVCVNKAEVTRNGDKIIPLEQASLHDWDDPHPYSDDDDDDDIEDDEDDDDENDEDYDDDDDDDDLMNDDFQERNTDDDDDGDDEDLLHNENNNNNKSDDEIPQTDSSNPSSELLGKQRLNRRPFAVKKCQTCPVVRPVFICGSDNRTYSSLCRLHYHNCIHEAKVHIACKGFCPCQESNNRSSKKDRQRKSSSSLSQYDHHSSSHNKQDRLSYEGENQKRRNGNKYGKVKGGYKTKYGGKHTYGKYTNNKYDKEENSYRNNNHAEGRVWGVSENNDVSRKTSNSVWGPNECSQDALAAMGNRMLDWFSVIMSDARAHASSNSKAPSWCKPEVAWMLGHLDSDADSRLSVKELYQLEHDDRERCIKPFIDRCDLDRDVFLSGREWCKCFDKSERPCAALRRASKGLLGGYIPECDSEGYYRSTQCHVTASMCWCVDKHGVEIPGSRTRTEPNCDAVMESQDLNHNRVDDDAEEGDDTEEAEGSADMPLDI